MKPHFDNALTFYLLSGQHLKGDFETCHSVHLIPDERGLIFCPQSKISKWANSISSKQSKVKCKELYKKKYNNEFWNNVIFNYINYKYNLEEPCGIVEQHGCLGQNPVSVYQKTTAMSYERAYEVWNRDKGNNDKL